MIPQIEWINVLKINNSQDWKYAGYTALIFLACVTYLGWWCQRYLREKFIERVKHLVDVEHSKSDTAKHEKIPVILVEQALRTNENKAEPAV